MTVALVGTFFPTVYAIPAFIGSAILGAVLLLPVRLYLAAAEVDISRPAPVWSVSGCLR